MTREEAIKMLEYLATDTTGTLAGYQGDYAEFLVRVIDALDMGIAALRERKSPCDLCRYNPPSSCDGKPCTMCPASPEVDV